MYQSYRLFLKVKGRISDSWYRYVYIEQRNGRRYKMVAMDGNTRSLLASLEYARPARQ